MWSVVILRYWAYDKILSQTENDKKNKKKLHTPLGLTRKQSTDFLFWAGTGRGIMQWKMQVTSEIQYIHVLHEPIKATLLFPESKLSLKQWTYPWRTVTPPKSQHWEQCFNIHHPQSHATGCCDCLHPKTCATRHTVMHATHTVCCKSNPSQTQVVGSLYIATNINEAIIDNCGREEQQKITAHYTPPYGSYQNVNKHTPCVNSLELMDHVTFWYLRINFFEQQPMDMSVKNIQDTLSATAFIKTILLPSRFWKILCYVKSDIEINAFHFVMGGNLALWSSLHIHCPLYPPTVSLNPYNKQV